MESHVNCVYLLRVNNDYIITLRPAAIGQVVDLIEEVASCPILDAISDYSSHFSDPELRSPRTGRFPLEYFVMKTFPFG